MKTLNIYFLLLLFSVMCCDLVLADMTVMTFDTIPAQQLADDAIYTENGMMATSIDESAWWIGDLLGDSGFEGNGTNGLYFHGSDAYIEIKNVDGLSFDLISLDFLTNGYTDERWIQTSTGLSMALPGFASMSFST